MITKLFQAPDGPAFGGLVSLLFGMPWSHFLIGLLSFEQMIDDDENAMGEGHDGLLVSHTLAQSLIISPQICSFTACSSICGLDESLAQPAIPLTSLGTEPFACTDLGIWTQTDPRNEMSFRGKLIHVGSQLGYDDLAKTHVDACHFIEDTDDLSRTQRRLRRLLLIWQSSPLIRGNVHRHVNRLLIGWIVWHRRDGHQVLRRLLIGCWLILHRITCLWFL